MTVRTNFFSKNNKLFIRSFTTAIYTIGFPSLILSSNPVTLGPRSITGVVPSGTVEKRFNPGPLHNADSVAVALGECLAAVVGTALGGAPVFAAASNFPGNIYCVAGVTLVLSAVPPQFKSGANRLARTVACA